MNDNEEETRARRAGVRMWPGVTAGVVIGLIAFVLSFDALRLVFVACGINPWLSWGGPVCVDGTILLCTWATWGFRKGHIRGGAYPWLGLVAFSLFSIAGNALHAVLNTGYQLPAWVAPAVMSIPPVALLYSTHLIVIIAGDRLDKISALTAMDGPAGDPTAHEPDERPADMSEPVVEPMPERHPAAARQALPDIQPMPSAPTVEPTSMVTPELLDGARTAVPSAEPEETAMAWVPSDEGRTIAGIPDLRDWMVPVPSMEADTGPKAVEAEADAADASEPEPDTPTVADAPVMREDITVPTLTIPTGSIPPADRIEPEETSVAEPSEPEPRPVETEPSADAAGTSTEAKTAVHGHGGTADGDGAWLDWVDATAATDARPTAAKAVDAGLAASISTAKRHLARLRREHPERFEPWKA